MKNNQIDQKDEKAENKLTTTENIKDLLYTNKKILDSFILENSQKKEKHFRTLKEIEIIQEYEKNLLKLLENCPPEILKKLINDENINITK